METKEVAYTAAIELAETLKKLIKTDRSIGNQYQASETDFCIRGWPFLVNAEGIGDAFDASGV